MGNSVPVPERPAVPEGKIRICVAGFGISHNVSQAQRLASAIAKAYPTKYQTWFYFSTFGFSQFLKVIKTEIPEVQRSLASTKDSGKTMAEHTSAPFVWLETTTGSDTKTTTMIAKGGRDMFCEWACQEFPDNGSIQELAKTETPPLSELFFDNTTPGGTWMEDNNTNSL
jgi:hypothetical protein